MENWLRIVVGLLMFFHIFFSFGTACLFTQEGRETSDLLTKIMEHQKTDKYVLLVADPITNTEPVFSVKSYLQFIGGQKNFAAYAVTKKKEYNSFEKMLIDMYPPDFPPYVRYKKIDDFDKKNDALQMIVIYPGLEKEFLQENSWLTDKIYTRLVAGSFILYYY